MRQLILVRHGQYEPETGRLTALGRRQARATAQALRTTPIHAIHCSTMPRARETADLIRKALRSRLPIRASHGLRERIPTPVEGITTRADLPTLREHLELMRRTFQRLARPTRGSATTTELVVAHGNLIRLFVCLALEVKPSNWLKLRIHNASITTLFVQAEWGEVLGSFNETAHLLPSERTLI